MIQDLKSLTGEMYAYMRRSYSSDIHSFRNNDEIMKRINILEHKRDRFKKIDNNRENNKASRHELKEYELIISSLDQQLDHLEKQLL